MLKINSLKESSLKKYKDSCHIIIVIGILGALFAWGSRHQIGNADALLSVVMDLILVIFSIIVLKTKSKIFSILIILTILILIALSVISIINGGSWGIGVGGFLIMLVSFNLYTHLNNIHKDYDKYYLAKFDLEDDDAWEKIKDELKEQYIPDGYKKIIDTQNQFKLKKDDIFYTQLSRNQLKCNLHVVGTKKPIIQG